MRRARARRRRASGRERGARWYDLARRLTSPVFALLGGAATLLYYVLALESSWAESVSTGASVAFLTFLAVEIPNMVFADMFVRGARAERDAAQALLVATEARAMAAEANVKQAEARAEENRVRAEENRVRAEEDRARAAAAEARAEEDRARAAAAQRRSDRLALVFIEALRDRDSSIDADELRRLFELEE